MPQSNLWLFRNATDDDENVLIFDSGYDGGDLHIYIHEESVPGERVREMATEEFGQSYDRPYLARNLADLKYGKAHGKHYTLKG